MIFGQQMNLLWILEVWNRFKLLLELEKWIEKQFCATGRKHPGRPVRTGKPAYSDLANIGPARPGAQGMRPGHPRPSSLPHLWAGPWVGPQHCTRACSGAQARTCSHNVMWSAAGIRWSNGEKVPTVSFTTTRCTRWARWLDRRHTETQIWR
jgi:hypothetical protein